MITVSAKQNIYTYVQVLHVIYINNWKKYELEKLVFYSNV